MRRDIFTRFRFRFFFDDHEVSCSRILLTTGEDTGRLGILRVERATEKGSVFQRWAGDKSVGRIVIQGETQQHGGWQPVFIVDDAEALMYWPFVEFNATESLALVEAIEFKIDPMKAQFLPGTEETDD